MLWVSAAGFGSNKLSDTMVGNFSLRICFASNNMNRVKSNKPPIHGLYLFHFTGNIIVAFGWSDIVPRYVHEMFNVLNCGSGFHFILFFRLSEFDHKEIQKTFHQKLIVSVCVMVNCLLHIGWMLCYFMERQEFILCWWLLAVALTSKVQYEGFELTNVKYKTPSHDRLLYGTLFSSFIVQLFSNRQTAIRKVFIYYFF